MALRVVNSPPHLDMLLRGKGLVLPNFELKAMERHSEHIEKRLIAPDEHLLPTPASQVLDDWKAGNAIITVHAGTGRAIGYTAYTERLGAQVMKGLGITYELPGLSELYCVVVDQEHRRQGIGTAMFREMLVAHYLHNDDVTSVITSQELAVRLFKRASDELTKQGVEMRFSAFSGEELPMLYLFLTLANPKVYSKKEVKRIEGTNPHFNVDKAVLEEVNRYLSGKSRADFKLYETDIMLFSHPSRAMNLDSELEAHFGTPEALREALIDIRYTI